MVILKALQMRRVSGGRVELAVVRVGQEPGLLSLPVSRAAWAAAAHSRV
jgi:hypothetical protein